MDEKTLISSIQSHLSDNIDEAVRTSGLEDERPVPSVIIDDWNTNDFNYHNSPFAGEAVGDFNDDVSVNYERYLNFDFVTRVEFEVRHQDEVDVTRLKDRVKNLLRLIRDRPQAFHEELKQCRIGGGGSPSYTFTEPKENELKLSARFYGDHTVVLTPPDNDNGDADTQTDTIETVEKNFSFNP
jgi:hypothetical protein